MQRRIRYCDPAGFDSLSVTCAAWYRDPEDNAMCEVVHELREIFPNRIASPADVVRYNTIQMRLEGHSYRTIAKEVQRCEARVRKIIREQTRQSRVLASALRIACFPRTT